MSNLRLLPHLFETIAREAIFGIVAFDHEGRALFTNSTAEQMLATAEPLLSDLTPADVRPTLKSFALELIQNDGFYQDILVRRADQTTFIANIGVRHLQIDGQATRLLMFQDVTVQKKLQREITAKQTEIKAAFEELLNQNRRLKELDQAKDRFIALTTHELRTPLSAMVASAEILKLGIYDGPDQLKEFIEIIHEQGLHLQDLVNDILDFAKIQAGKMDFYLEPLDPRPLCAAIVHQFEGMAQANRVTLAVETASTDDLTCYFDELRLRQIVSNIVNNAIKYNRPEGRVQVRFSREASEVHISVTDSGQGISPDQFDKVFNEFETIGHVAQHHKGTGLGMPISRKLTEGMGGRLDLASELGVGSTFTVKLPVTKVLEDDLYRPRPEKGGIAA